MLKKMERRSIVFLIGAGIAVLAGFIVAWRLELSPRENQITPAGQDRSLILTEITLATLADPAEASRPNPRLLQKRRYKVDQPLALRVTADSSVKEPFEVGARLVSDSGQIVPLNPSRVMLAPGTSTYCCWQVDKEGTYTMQILGAEKILSSISLTIIK